MQNPISKRIVLGAAAFGMLALAGCATNTTEEQPEQVVYTADLQPLNAEVTGTQTQGKVYLTVKNGEIKAAIDVKDAPGSTEHWQHFHGFTDGSEAACATPAADANADGIVDLIETEAASGTTMVPFDGNPAAMDVAHGRYPMASPDGSYSYRQVISLDKLKNAFDEAFGGPLELEHRVIYIHGVPESTELPDSVASLGPIPAQTTLPIACGEIERVK